MKLQAALTGATRSIAVIATLATLSVATAHSTYAQDMHIGIGKAPNGQNWPTECPDLSNPNIGNIPLEELERLCFQGQQQQNQCRSKWDSLYRFSVGCDDLENFANSNPGTSCAQDARKRINVLQCGQTPPPPNPTPQQSPPPQETYVEEYRNTDFDNSGAEHLDLRRINNSSLSRCKNTCLNDGRCNYYTFNQKYAVCFTKSGVNKRVSWNGAMSGRIVRQGQSQPPTPQQQPKPVTPTGNDFVTYANTDIYGYDLRFDSGKIFTRTNESNCKRLCLNVELCKAFTFNRKARACFLKYHVGQRSRFNGAVSGVVRGR